MRLRLRKIGIVLKRNMEDPVDRLKRIVDQARKKLARREYAIDASMAYLPAEARKQVAEVNEMQRERCASQDRLDDQV